MFKTIIFVAFVIASVLAAPAPVPAPAAAPAPKPHYVSSVPFGYASPYIASTYVASPYVGAYASPYSYAYSPIGVGAYSAYGAYGAYPYAFY